MPESLLRDVANHLNCQPGQLHAEEVAGGFTKAAKYVLDIDQASDLGLPPQLFVKAVDAAAEPNEAVVLKTEAMQYAGLEQAGLAGEGKIFPAFFGAIDMGATTALLIEYMSDMSWGGPWSRENIDRTLHAMRTVHATKLEPDIKERFQVAHKQLIDHLLVAETAVLTDEQKITVFDAAWEASDLAVHNTRGEVYFRTAHSDLRQKIRAAAVSYNEHSPERLNVNDVNFANFGFNADGVRIVDPAYVRIGNPAGDLTTLGINILRKLPDDHANAGLRQYVRQQFLGDLPALAFNTLYWLSCAMLPDLTERGAWGEFQQDCALTALRVWEDIASAN